MAAIPLVLLLSVYQQAGRILTAFKAKIDFINMLNIHLRCIRSTKFGEGGARRTKAAS
jgi:hypothetical protein